MTTWEGLLGEEFTGDVANSWQTLLDYVVAVMVEGNRVYVEEERRCNLVTTPEVDEVEDRLSLRTDVQLKLPVCYVKTDSGDIVMDSSEIGNIGIIVTDIMGRMNLSKPDTALKDYFKSIGIAAYMGNIIVLGDAEEELQDSVEKPFDRTGKYVQQMSASSKEPDSPRSRTAATTGNPLDLTTCRLRAPEAQQSENWIKSLRHMDRRRP
ncbi:unnamed protein product [Hymenolepis diminuta]|uniref:Sm domain-containing protein n=1 Tax=Hymenolepis diminuta TaxID=6216 RepID=A0A0R3SKP9_HYMDI|nr:unnamed protein product [Hymenolepis diminuta]